MTIKPTTIPVIKKQMSTLAASDVAGAQVYDSEIFEILARIVPSTDHEGDTRPVFEVFWGGEWISADVWCRLKLSGL